MRKPLNQNYFLPFVISGCGHRETYFRLVCACMDVGRIFKGGNSGFSMGG